VTGKFGDLARSLAGEAIPGDETPFEALPVR
jgi:hypothetical protein